MKLHVKRFAVAMLAAMLLSFAAGCRNTAQGVGKDVENAGEKIQEKTK